jgi:hypothetical protein
MGIFSWLSSRRSFSWLSTRRYPDDDSGGPHSLVRLRYEDPDLEETERAAAADVAAVEEDAKYFGRDAPGHQQDDL